jgi:hypothetical protein
MMLLEEAWEESYQCSNRLYTHVKQMRDLLHPPKTKRGFFCPTKSKIVNLPELVCSAKGHTKTVQDALGAPSTTRFSLESREQ